MDPATIAALITTFGPMLAGKFGGSGQTSGQKRDENLLDEILRSVEGQGKYSNLFEADYDSFQKSFVDPAMQQFNDVTAPGIQQNFIASGQQRGTGLDDSLSRAGVDMQQMLNQQYAGFQDSAKERQFRALQGIPGKGYQKDTQGGWGQAIAGGASQSGFPEGLETLLKQLQSAMSGQSGNVQPNSVNPNLNGGR